MTTAEGLLLVLLGIAVALDTWPAVQSMVSRPIVVGPLVGLVLGAPGEGAFWGAVFEALYLGVLPVGAARIPDAGLGALAGTAVALVGGDATVAPAGLAVVVGLAAGRLGEATDVLVRRRNGQVAARVAARVAAGDVGAPGRGLAVGLALAALAGAAGTAVALTVGLVALELASGTPLTGPVPVPWLRAAALAAAAAAGARLFLARGRRAWAWVAGALGGVLLAAGSFA